MAKHSQGQVDGLVCGSWAAQDVGLDGVRQDALPVPVSLAICNSSQVCTLAPATDMHGNRSLHGGIEKACNSSMNGCAACGTRDVRGC